MHAVLLARAADEGVVELAVGQRLRGLGAEQNVVAQLVAELLKVALKAEVLREPRLLAWTLLFGGGPDVAAVLLAVVDAEKATAVAQSLSEPMIRPLVKYRCRNGYTQRIGVMVMMSAAAFVVRELRLLKICRADVFSRSAKSTSTRILRRNPALYVMLIPGLLNLLLFKYLPMWGVVIGFQQFHPALGVLGSKWVGFKHYIDFFNDPYFFRLVRNTLLLGLYTLAFSFPAPIVLALLLNEVRRIGFKRVTQTISYMPYFISTVLVIGLLREFTSPNDGIVNAAIAALGGERIAFFLRPL